MSHFLPSLILLSLAISNSLLMPAAEVSCSKCPFNWAETKKAIHLSWDKSGMSREGCNDVVIESLESIKEVPKIQITLKSLLSENDLYTIVMQDPDAPQPSSANEKAPWLHWIRINVPATQINGGEDVLAYAPPTPPSSSPAHRYFFAIFKQADRLSPRQLMPELKKHQKFDVNGALRELNVDVDNPVDWICFKAVTLESSKSIKSHKG